MDQSQNAAATQVSPGAATPASTEVRSTSEYVEAVLDLGRSWLTAWRRHQGEGKSATDLEVWYRGHEKSSYRLLPSAYRVEMDHESAFNRFRSMAHQYLPEMAGRDEWEWYSAAQHYGIPTRLLDWTDDPMVGLHFAFAKLPESEIDSADPPCVWVMEAASLNAIAYGDDQLYVSDTSGPAGSWLPGQLPSSGPSSLGSDSEGESERESESGIRPIAILPNWSNRRILAQRGRFTVHGIERRTIDDYFAVSGKPEYRNNIAKIVLVDPGRVEANSNSSVSFAIGSFRKQRPLPSTFAGSIRRHVARRERASVERARELHCDS